MDSTFQEQWKQKVKIYCMSYTINWITKVISIPTIDLTFVSGTRYSLNMADFLTEIRRLEWDPTEGLWAPAIVDHTNTRYDFAGVNYAPFDEILNGYTIQITGIATRVDLLGSNNNIVDVFIATGISLVPSNSAGLQIVIAGSGVTPGDIDDIVAGVWAYVTRTLTAGTKDSEIDAIAVFVEEISKLTGNRVSRTGDIITIYEDNGTTIWRKYDLTNQERIQV